jgi:hypothetical protein
LFCPSHTLTHWVWNACAFEHGITPTSWPSSNSSSKQMAHPPMSLLHPAWKVPLLQTGHGGVGCGDGPEHAVPVRRLHFEMSEQVPPSARRRRYLEDVVVGVPVEAAEFVQGLDEPAGGLYLYRVEVKRAFVFVFAR